MYIFDAKSANEVNAEYQREFALGAYDKFIFNDNEDVY